MANIDPYDYTLEATQEVEDEAEATLVAVLEERRDIAFDRNMYQSESQRDVLPAIPPETAELMTSLNLGGSSMGGSATGGAAASGSAAAASLRPPPVTVHRRAGSAISDLPATQGSSSSADTRMNLLMAARENLSQKNLGIDLGSSTAAGCGTSSLDHGPGGGAVRGRSRFAQLVMKVKDIRESDETGSEGGSRGSRSRENRSILSRSSASRKLGPATSHAGTGAGTAGGSVKTSTTGGDIDAIAPSPFLGTSAVPGHHNRLASNTEQLFQNAQLVEELFNIEEGDEGEGDDDDGSVLDVTHTSGSDLVDYQKYHDEESPLVGTKISSGQSRSVFLAKCLSCLKPKRNTKKAYYPVLEVLGPKILFAHLVRFLRTKFIFILVPLFITASILFSYCGNPRLPFLPNDASLSWWLLFTLRQLSTLQLSWASEYVVVEAIACRSPSAIRLFGPLITLFAMQAKGWPFTVASWAAWDLVLLHGEHPFAKNWLFFLDIPMLSDANGDDGFLSSDAYLRFLLAAVFAGTVSAIKRTYLALYMGRRTFDHYKPQLEQLMVNIVLLSHIADLAAETETPEFAEALALTEEYDIPLSQRGRNRESIRRTGGRWNDIKFEQNKKAAPVVDSSDDEEDEAVAVDANENADVAGDATKKINWNKMLEGQSVTSDDAPVRGGDISPRRDAATSLSEIAVDPHQDASPPMRTIAAKHIGNTDAEGSAPPPPVLHAPFPGYQRQTSSKIKIKELLERWEEPINKLDKAVAPSIHDILQFRRALDYLDDTHPFSESFGNSETRDQCIRSSQKVFKRLLNFVPGETVLPFDVIGSIAMDEDGIYDRDASLALVRLFRPDKNDCLTMLNFVQSCDWVYRKVRYLRASVANSTLIDRVLEHDFNIFFYVFIVLIVMSILNFDPWSLLFSMSTLLVSFAFAVGPSAAKAIEGFFLIAMQRPYDLGDRICVTSAQFAGNPDVGQNWFVEDVNLFTTTLRYAPTNEISTVNNGSLANSRIINFARSSKALVNLTLLFKSDATGKQIQLFRSALEQYIKNNPRVWSVLVVFLINNIDPDAEVTEYKLRVQHVKGWQEMATVQINQGELLEFCISLMQKMDIAYDSPKSRVSVELTTAKSGTENESADLLRALPSLRPGKRNNSVGSSASRTLK